MKALALYHDGTLSLSRVHFFVPNACAHHCMLCFCTLQTTGTCYGDSLHLMSPHNETISLCGNRDGLALQLSGYKDRLILAFKSLERSTGNI